MRLSDEESEATGVVLGGGGEVHCGGTVAIGGECDEHFNCAG